MNYLCAFLLLAFAAGSVHSKFWLRPKCYERALKDELTKLCQTHLSIPLDTLPLLTVVDGLSQVTGVLISNPVIASVAIDSSSIQAVLTVIIDCDLFKKVNIQVDIDIKIVLNLKNGYPFLRLSSIPSVVLSIIGTPNVDITLIEAVLTAITGTVTEAAKNMLIIIENEVNCHAKSFIDVQIIGGERCNYEISSMEIVDGLLHGVLCVNIGGVTVYPNDVTLELEEDDLLVVAVTDSMLTAIVTPAMKSFNYTVQVPYTLLGELGKTIGSVIHFRMSITGIDACSFTTDGADMTILLIVELLELEKPFSSATTKSDLTAEIVHGHGYWGLKLSESGPLVSDLKVIDDGCECQNLALPLLQELLKCHMAPMVSHFNAIFDLFMPLPVIRGTCIEPNIEPQQGYCKFDCY